MTSQEHQTQMTTIEAIVTNLLTEIDRIVDQKVETKLPEMIRALGLRETNPEEEDLIDAVEVAKMLGRDVSTKHSILCARKHVYNLAQQKLIPSVRLSPRRVMFNRVAIRKVIDAGGLAKQAA
jgi:predicted DNA-binding transcriptional regulator AlpA